jgi:hypothetical protein
MRSAWFAVLLCLGGVVSVAPWSPTVAWAQADSSSDAEARRRFEEGRRLYEAGQFAEAAQAFRRAYVLSPRYQLLYNIGQAELRAGRDAQALEAFEGFLRQAPAGDPSRSEVEERVRVLRALGVAPSEGTVRHVSPSPTRTSAEGARGAAAETDSQATSPGHVESRERGGSPGEPDAVDLAAPRREGEPGKGGGNPGPWIVVGVGGAFAVGGAVLMGLGLADASTVTGAAPGTMWSQISDAAGRANVEWGMGLVLVGAGLAAVGGGVVWAVVGGGSGESTSAQVSFGPGGVTLSGCF